LPTEPMSSSETPQVKPRSAAETEALRAKLKSANLLLLPARGPLNKMLVMGGLKYRGNAIVGLVAPNGEVYALDDVGLVKYTTMMSPETSYGSASLSQKDRVRASHRPHG